MKETIAPRISELKDEFEAGQKLLVELESRQNGLREQLLRISGAIQVLEEMMAETENDAKSNIKEFKVASGED